MKNLRPLILMMAFFSIHGYCQEKPLSPENNLVDMSLIRNDTSKMAWYILQDTTKIEIGTVVTEVKKRNDKLFITSIIDLKQSATNWVDSTIVKLKTLKPIYHSSFNPQRNMILKFGEVVTGYYLDKKTNTKTDISERTTRSYFDSNFYPQLIRWLPLNEGYSKTISIFDYNPNAKIGTLSATVQKVEKGSMEFKGRRKSIWKVSVTDDISNNKAISTYYIDQKTRKILRQEIDMQGRKMTMESVE